MKKKSVRVPSGKARLHYFRRLSRGEAVCEACGAALHSTGSKGPKSAKRPLRKFGGKLCPACTKYVLVLRARGEAPEDMRYAKYLR